MTYEWKDKAVLITGGAHGIGAATVRLVLQEGAKYIAILDIATDEAKALQDDLNTRCGKQVVHFHQCDVSVEEQIETAFRAVVEECGYIDVVINNAGILNDKGLMFRKEVEINYTGVVSLSLKTLDLMRKDERGRGGTIINISSIGALSATPFYPVYCGTKAAVLLFNLCLGMDDYYTRTDVRTITVCFGVTQTGIFNTAGTFDRLYDEQIPAIRDSFPAQSAEVAASGVSEAFKKARSGSTWVVNNGRVKEISGAVARAYNILTEAID